MATPKVWNRFLLYRSGRKQTEGKFRLIMASQLNWTMRRERGGRGRERRPRGQKVGKKKTTIAKMSGLYRERQMEEK